MIETWRGPDKKEKSGCGKKSLTALILAALFAVFLVVAPRPASATSAPWIHLLSTSSTNLSYKTTSGALGALKPGQSNYGTQVYAPLSGTTVYTINGGSTVFTQAKGTWKTLVAGNSYAYKRG